MFLIELDKVVQADEATFTLIYFSMQEGTKMFDGKANTFPQGS